MDKSARAPAEAPAGIPEAGYAPRGEPTVPGKGTLLYDGGVSKWPTFALLSLGLLACTSKGSDPSAPPPPPEPTAPPVEAPAEAEAEGPASRPASQPSVSAHGEKVAEPEVTEVHGLPNVSGIAYVNAACTGEAPCKCAGALVYGDNALAKIGVTKERLAEGVWCVFGDFDANGYADVAVLGAKWAPGGPAAPAQVLLFDEVGLRATAPLPKRMKSLGRFEVDGRQVLAEPAAANKYHFAYTDAGRFELTQAK